MFFSSFLDALRWTGLEVKDQNGVHRFSNPNFVLFIRESPWSLPFGVSLVYEQNVSRVNSLKKRFEIVILIDLDGSQPTTTEGNNNLEQTQRILTNSTESFLTFTAAKLALASVLDANDLRLIPALSGLFILG